MKHPPFQRLTTPVCKAGIFHFCRIPTLRQTIPSRTVSVFRDAGLLTSYLSGLHLYFTAIADLHLLLTGALRMIFPEPLPCTDEDIIEPETGTVLLFQPANSAFSPLFPSRYEQRHLSDFEQKKGPLDTLNRRTSAYLHGFKSCDPCASKGHPSRVTLYSVYYAAFSSIPSTLILFFCLQQCFSLRGTLPLRLRISISPKQQCSL